MEGNWSLAQKKGALWARAATIQAVRNFFITGGYLEVDTPLRIPAPAPEAHIDAIPSGSWFLQTSPEICMKRMLAAGYDRIFQICPCWRANERGSRHLPEFTMLEWYRAGADYFDLMAECEKLFQSLATILFKNDAIVFNGRIVSLAPPWERLTVRDAFRRFGGTSMESALARGLFDEIMALRIEPQLGQETPTFLYDYPAQAGALARLKRDDTSVAERFELYIGGLELANAFSELTDAEEQRQRFYAENTWRSANGKTVYPSPERFLAELSLLPPAAGIALGIDRLVMVFQNAESIDRVVAFTPEDLQ
jgi:elongation factor P--(R)-beta-lysine ligase